MEIFPFLTPPTLEIPQHGVHRDGSGVWWMNKLGMVPAHTPIAFWQIKDKQIICSVFCFYHIYVY